MRRYFIKLNEEGRKTNEVLYTEIPVSVKSRKNLRTESEVTTRDVKKYYERLHPLNAKKGGRIVIRFVKQNYICDFSYLNKLKNVKNCLVVFVMYQAQL